MAARFPANELFGLQYELFGFYEQALVDPPLVTDVGMRQAAGVSNGDFVRFRAAVYAVGDVCRGLARALQRRVEAGADSAVEHELMEWVTINWHADFLIGTRERLSGLSPSDIERPSNSSRASMLP